jgi:hypothetical protein
MAVLQFLYVHAASFTAPARLPQERSSAEKGAMRCGWDNAVLFSRPRTARTQSVVGLDLPMMGRVKVEAWNGRRM